MLSETVSERQKTRMNDKKKSWKYHEVGDLFPCDGADKEC